MTKELRKRYESFFANSDNAVARKLLADLALEIGQYEVIGDEIVATARRPPFDGNGCGNCGGRPHSIECWVGRFERLAELR